MNQTSTTASAGSASAQLAPWAALSARKVKPSSPVMRQESPWSAWTSSAGGVSRFRPGLVGAPGELREVAHFDAEGRGAVLGGTGRGQVQGQPAGAGVELPPGVTVNGLDQAQIGEEPLPRFHPGGEVDGADTQHAFLLGFGFAAR